MESRILTRSELRALYESELTATFPPEELKPLRAMEVLLDRGAYVPLGFFEEGTLLAYALLWTAPGVDCVLLDYLGVTAALRGRGLGHRVLQQAWDFLSTRWGGIVAEAEALGGAGESGYEDRLRRIRFYEDCGYRKLSYDCALFGVRFHCMYRGGETDDSAVLALHRAIYADHFSPAHMERFIQIPLRPGEDVHPAPRWLEEDGTL